VHHVDGAGLEGGWGRQPGGGGVGVECDDFALGQGVAGENVLTDEADQPASEGDG